MKRKKLFTQVQDRIILRWASSCSKQNDCHRCSDEKDCQELADLLAEHTDIIGKGAGDIRR